MSNVIVNETESLAVADIRAVILAQERDLLFNHMRENHVVSVQQADELPVCAYQTGISGSREPFVLLIEVPYPPSIGFHNLSRIIGGSVVHYENVDGTIRLPQSGIYRITEISTGVEARDYDVDQALTHCLSNGAS
jgi:hypothetical protein